MPRPIRASGLSLPMARDLVFGGLEHIVWTALVQGRLEDQIDVPKLSRDLAGAYLRAFGLDEYRGATQEASQEEAQRGRRWHTACHQTPAINTCRVRRRYSVVEHESRHLAPPPEEGGRQAGREER